MKTWRKSPMPTVESSLNPTGDTRAALRHLLATLAYRAAKVLRDAPADFPRTEFGATARRPVQIVAHMGDLFTWAVSLTRGESIWKAEGGEDWTVECRR